MAGTVLRFHKTVDLQTYIKEKIRPLDIHGDHGITVEKSCGIWNISSSYFELNHPKRLKDGSIAECWKYGIHFS